MKQKVEELPLFPVRTWRFRAPKQLTDEVELKVRDLEYRCYNEDGGCKE